MYNIIFLENATLVFLPGCHTLTPYNSLFLVSSLTMIGVSTEVFICDTKLVFIVDLTLHIENLTLSDGRFLIFATSQFRLFSITAINYVIDLHYTMAARMHNCKFSNGTSQLFVDNSQVTLSGNSKFFNTGNSALVSYSSTIILSGTVSFVNNSGIRGGAMALYSSDIYLTSGLTVSFINNSAQETGGAIHIDPDMTHTPSCPECFYDAQNQTAISFQYSDNHAEFGGDNIYGTSLDLCKNLCITNYFQSSVSMSSVSSDPRKVCLCDSDGQPQCKNVPLILTSKNVHPGEMITVPVVLVGGDYGTTIGTVHASFKSTNLNYSVPVLEASHQYRQWINNIPVCTDLEYTVFTRHTRQNFIMYLNTSKRTDEFYSLCDDDFWKNPTFINLTILPCPMGFGLSSDLSTCNCHSILSYNGLKCEIVNARSYFSWNNTLWMKISDMHFTYSMHCPLHYCDPAGKRIEFKTNSSAQCVFNRAGRLCGGCKDGYSLAIGSSHCIHCPNNNNLALLIFFAAAGFLLVFFISTLNITLTQGLLNGLIFYANIIWTYRSVLFPEGHQSNVIFFLKTFIAWLNLDFGIETCFVKGLTSVWKTWLQFIFPLYIWAIVGLIILTAKHSTTVTKLYGNRAVPVLATLFLLSYMKLLRMVTSIYMFSEVFQYPEKSKVIVWSVDGNIDYFGLPHSLLMVAALVVQMFLWLPYTLILLLHQQLQKISHIRVFKRITQLKPFFDVHFAPLKPAYRYWFGVLLLARGVLLTIFSASFATPTNTNLLLLLMTIIILLLYMAIVQPYKNKLILVIQSSFLANVLFLGIFIFYAENNTNKHTLKKIAVGISTGVVFFQFCGLIICNVIRLCCHAKCNSYKNRAYLEDEDELDENFSTNYRAYIMKALF